MTTQYNHTCSNFRSQDSDWNNVYNDFIAKQPENTWVQDTGY